MKTIVYLTNVFLIVLYICLRVDSKEVDKEEVDKVIEDEITQKLSEDLLQSIEKKFNVDLERSVDSVLAKIKLLLQNGTTQIQDRLSELQAELDVMKMNGEKQVDDCLLAKQNDTTALAEKALHQMVVCGYALIGHDPAQAVRNVMELKAMIKKGLKPIYEKKEEVFKLLKVCGHDHDSLKKVIKCVISKSPQVKAAMMTVSSKLIDGVVHLTKQMAHGAMHEACLIEVIKSIEIEAFGLLVKVKKCTTNNGTINQEEVDKYMKENNATVLDIDMRAKDSKKKKEEKNTEATTATAATTITEAPTTTVATEKAETKKPENKEVEKKVLPSSDNTEFNEEEQKAVPKAKTVEDIAKEKENQKIKTVLRRMLKQSKAKEGLENSFSLKKSGKDHVLDDNIIASETKNKNPDK